MELNIKLNYELTEQQEKERDMFNKKEELSELPKALLIKTLGIDNPWDLLRLYPRTDIISYFEDGEDKIGYRIIKWIDVEKIATRDRYIYKGKDSKIVINKKTDGFMVDDEVYYPMSFSYDNEKKTLGAILLKATEKTTSKITIKNPKRNIL